MPENENDMNERHVNTRSGSASGRRGSQAEEFAEEMHAEPKNIDGQPGVATVDGGAGPGGARTGRATAEASMSMEEIWRYGRRHGTGLDGPPRRRNSGGAGGV